MSSLSNEVTLKYWNGRGLMEVPRLMMAIGGRFPGAGYSDVRIGEGGPSTVGDLTSNLGRAPVCETPQGCIGQSSAINYYVANLNGLMGGSAFETASIISFEEHLQELMTAFRGLVPYGTEPTAEALDKFFDLNEAVDFSGVADMSKRSSRFLLWFMGRLENLLDASGYCVGGKISLADVLVFSSFGDSLAADETLSELPAHRRESFASKERVDSALAKHPKIKAVVDNVRDNEGVKKWLAMRGKQGF